MRWVKLFFAENESHIYPNMCDKFGCGPTVVSKKGGDRQTKCDSVEPIRMIERNPFR